MPRYSHSFLPGVAASHPVIGVVHVQALPGAPRFAGDLEALRAAARADARAYAAGGAHALIVENFGDAPFHVGRVPAATVAHMTAIAREIRADVDLPLGVNVLRNAGVDALAVAQAAGADFVRVNVLVGARLTDQGIVEGIAAELLRRRAALGAESIRILADVNVKHSTPLGPGYSVAQEVREALERGGADAVIASGPATGAPTDAEELRTVRAAAGKALVLVGSGVTVDSVGALATLADGFIVGTALKEDGVVGHPVDPARVQALLAALG